MLCRIPGRCRIAPDGPELFPLDCAGGFGGDVVDDAVDPAHLVDEAGRGAAKEFVRERGVVGGHALGRGDRAQGADEIVGPAVAHHADAPHRQQDGKRLPDRVVETGVADLLQEDRVGLAQDVELRAGDLAGDADRQTGAGDRVALDKFVGQSQLTAQFAYLVLEQFAQGLDELQFHAGRQAADIVMRFDRNRGTPEWAHRLDYIGVEGALRQELDIADLVRLFVEDVDKGGADRLALLFGVGDAGELFEEQSARIAMDQRDVVMPAEEAHDLLRLARPQQAGIDKDAGQLVADRLVEQGRRYRGIDTAGETADNPAFTNLAADLVDRLAAEQRHRPVPAAVGNPVREIAQQLSALRRVHDLRVEQHAVKATAVVGDRSVRCPLAGRHRAKAGRQCVYPVAVAHPHLLAPAPWGAWGP